jgi:alkanesulfonate monooxygenase SsuD/methylene tetrahydromethanopterin reductase-like flavin-dependent oxidoreductase (luciferase family)
MRFVLEAPAGDFEATRTAAESARDAGFDAVLLAPNPAAPAPLVTASAVAGSVEGLLLAVEVPLGDRHPLEVAEEASVVDLCSGGRLILIVHPAEGAEADFEEAVRFLLTAFASRPFRFDGARWTVPANLPENIHNIEHRTRLMPPPRQPRLELWASGVAVDVALRYGLGHLADATTPRGQLRREWAAADEELPWAVRLPRASRDVWTSGPAMVEQLRAGRAEFDQDWTVIQPPLAVLAEIGCYVRPRVQLDSLPVGLEAHWDSART